MSNEKITNAILNIQHIFTLNEKNIKTGTTLVEAKMRTSFNQIKNQNQSDLKKNKFSLNQLIENAVLPKIKIGNTHIFLPESIDQTMKLHGQQLKLYALKEYTKTSCPMLAFYVVSAYANRKGAKPNAEKIKKYFSQIQALAENIFANTNAENNQQLIKTETELLQDQLSQNHLKNGTEIRRHYIADNKLDVDKTSEMFNRWVWLVAIAQFLANKWPQAEPITGKKNRKMRAIVDIEILLTSDYAYYKKHEIDALERFLQTPINTHETDETNKSQNSTTRTDWAQLLSSYGLFAGQPNNHSRDISSKIEEKNVYTI